MRGADHSEVHIHTGSSDGADSDDSTNSTFDRSDRTSFLGKVTDIPRHRVFGDARCSKGHVREGWLGPWEEGG